MLLFTKLLVIAVYLLWVLAVVMVRFSGHRARSHFRDHVEAHKHGANAVLIATAMLIVAVEGLRIESTGPHMASFGLIFWVHLAAALTFTAGMCTMRFIYRGDMHAKIHQKLARTMLYPGFVVASVTGPVLIYLA